MTSSITPAKAERRSERSASAASASPTRGLFGTIAACGHLLALTIRRLLRSRQSAIGLGLLLLCSLIVLAWSRQSDPTTKKFAEQILVPTYLAFLLPILA